MRERESQVEGNLLDRETPLTIEEIASARSENFEISSYGGQKYRFGDTEISILREFIDKDKIKNDDHKNQILDVLKSRKQGEIGHYKTLLVNVLAEQARIARKFGTPAEGLYQSMKLDYGYRFGDAKDLMGSFGDIYALQLVKHIETLKKLGANEDEIAIELAGHVFHEAVHQGENGLNGALLNGGRALGEVTYITSQLAYYLEKGYQGPKSYDSSFSKRGIKKIQDGEASISDHDVATSVSHELLLTQLRANYPEIAEGIKTESSFDACEEIVAKISAGQRDQLIACLKRAILESTSEEKFKEVVEKLKKNNSKNK